MEAVVKTSREPGIEVRDVATPGVGPSDILVRVKAGSLCGSDVHIYEWTAGYEWLPIPLTLGHEFSGEVVEVGAEVETVNVGDRITALPSIPCGDCACCRTGRASECTKKLSLGLKTHGAFAEYVRLSAGASIFKIPDNLSYEVASLCEPFSVALNAVDISDIKVGQTAAVLGPGPIGLFTLQALKTAGAGFVLVAGTNGDKDRLRLAERLGADAVINVEEEDPVSAAQAVTDNGTVSGLDFVFEATGNPQSVPQALDMLRDGGMVVLIGIHSGPAQFNPTALVRSKKSIVGAYCYENDTWRRTLLLFGAGRIRVDEIVTHRLALSEAEKAFELAANKEAIKVLFVP